MAKPYTEGKIHHNDTLMQGKSWPFEQARNILEYRKSDKGYVLFETGYGPSGLPHIGTFGEVLRTSLVRHAFMQLSPIPTRLYCVSDDMDALRKVPENIPNPEKLIPFIGYPLTKVPDPFGTHESFAAHNNARLCKFLDHFGSFFGGFDYIFKSSTESYKEGVYDPTILRIAEHYDAIMAVMTQHLRQERLQTYSPFMPICPRTGKVLQVRMEKINPTLGTGVYQDPENGSWVEIPLTGGHCKLQWKVDWPMRWIAYDVDYEMYGKDLIDSVTVGRQIMEILGHQPPAGQSCELFLDENGKKISKSKGNGLSLEDWLHFAPPESLAYYMFLSPQRAKKLYFDVIPQATDSYLDLLHKFREQNDVEKVDNPVWHLHRGDPPEEPFSHISFSLLLILAAMCDAQSKEILWGFVQRYDENLSPERNPFLDTLIEGAVNYNQKFVQKNFRKPDERDRKALEDLLQELKKIPSGTKPEDIQYMIYEVGKRHPYDSLKDWFQMLYEVLLGQERGPRMGTFVSLFGLQETCALIQGKLA